MQNPVLKPGQHILQMELEMHSIPRSDKAYQHYKLQEHNQTRESVTSLITLKFLDTSRPLQCHLYTLRQLPRTILVTGELLLSAWTVSRITCIKIS